MFHILQMGAFVFVRLTLCYYLNQTNSLKWGGEGGYSKIQNIVFVLVKKKKITFILQGSILLKYYTERKVELFVGKQNIILGNYTRINIVLKTLKQRGFKKITQ